MLSENQEIQRLLQEYLDTKDAEAVLAELDELIRRKKIVMEDAERPDKASERRNGGRLPGTYIYLSLPQLKDSILKGMPILLLKFKLQPDKVVENSVLQLLPQILAALHIVKKKERCIFVEAIEFFSRDGKFHPVGDFIPKLGADSACDNLDVECDFCRKMHCDITPAAVAEALDKLEQKHILEKRIAGTERNFSYEYRYCKW